MYFVFMSATTETLLLQIISLEEKLAESRLRGEDCTNLEDALFELKNRFSSLNETLNKNQNVLKG
jgi:hypothetical protein